jgi:hypothetical protein
MAATSRSRWPKSVCRHPAADRGAAATGSRIDVKRLIVLRPNSWFEHPPCYSCYTCYGLRFMPENRSRISKWGASRFGEFESFTGAPPNRLDDAWPFLTRGATPHADLRSARLIKTLGSVAMPSLFTFIGRGKRPNRHHEGGRLLDLRHRRGASTSEIHRIAGTATQRPAQRALFAASCRRSLSAAQAA